MLRRAKSFIQRKKHDDGDKDLPESAHLKRRGSIKVVRQHREPDNAKKITPSNDNRDLAKTHSRSQENIHRKPPVPPRINADTQREPVKKQATPGEFKSWPHEGKSAGSNMIMRSNPLYRSERSVLKQPTREKTSTDEPPWKPPNTVRELVTSINKLYLDEESQHSRNPAASAKKPPATNKRLYHQTEF
ncbi:hypothetical protein GWI33_015075 [Rhynchophorus ferrugineus]|uniref:Uncharacterized protein n=1 Tax=Rhynchophorus ferrugineus TaxID=354439 RepID=A0A834I640_RHYFE|nr:hypothetical protein GWI33_015075 [Rhynchophorus ferrugineus]